MEINRIYNENCLTTIARMPDGFVDLVVTSPPYGDLRKYNGYSFEFEKIAKELYRCVKKHGVVIWVVGDQTEKGSESGVSFKQALFFKEIGFNLHDTMIYEKLNYIPLTHNRYEQCFEYMFVLSKGKPATFNPITISCNKTCKGTNKTNQKAFEQTYAMRKRDEFVKVKETKLHSNKFAYAVGGRSTTKTHNAPFPLQLAKDQIQSWSNESELVYDPMVGSGTTAIAAIQLNRQWLGSEISKDYCCIANERIGA